MHYYAFKIAMKCDTVEQFLEAMLHHREWKDVSGKPIPGARTDWLIQFWLATRRTFKEILKTAGLTQKKFQAKYFVPLRTIESWSAGERECNVYTLLLIQESLGIFERYAPEEAYTGVLRP